MPPTQPSVEQIQHHEGAPQPWCLSVLMLSASFLPAFPPPQEFAHWLLPREHVVNSYVMVDAHNKVTDLCR